MKVYVQWATDPPLGYQEIDSSQWSSLPKKDEPPADRKPIRDINENVIGFTGTDVIINFSKGWIYDVYVQGMGFNADHIAVIDGDGFTKIITWNDDLNDIPAKDVMANEWKFYPPRRKPNGRLESMLYRTWYMKPEKRIELESNGVLPNYTGEFIGDKPTKVKNYSQFQKPSNSITRHGIWLLSRLSDRLTGLETRVSWETWAE